ncbi:Hypothetical predicted protein, partial [Mytilus galloprovincialis]
KCQDLEKFVAPILDNKGAPIVAIVYTKNISAHIVRSIEIPFREIINYTIKCKINEELETVKQDIVSLRINTGEEYLKEIHERKISTKIVDNLKADLEEQMKNLTKHVDLMKSGLQETIDEHIRDKKNHLTEIKQDIITLRKDMEEKITNEIIKRMENFTKIVNTKLDEKVKNFNNNVEVVQSELRKPYCL